MSVQAITKQVIRETLQKIKERTGKDVQIDEVEWSNRMSRAWGRAELGTYCGRRIYRIKLAAKVFTEDSEALRTTVIHEVAHIADFQLYNNWGHGPTWKGIMRMLGQSPNRLATREEMKQVNLVAKRKVLKYVYKCSCREHYVAGKAHSSMRRGSVYLCKHCRSSLYYTGQVTKA